MITMPEPPLPPVAPTAPASSLPPPPPPVFAVPLGALLVPLAPEPPPLEPAEPAVLPPPPPPRETHPIPPSEADRQLDDAEAGETAYRNGDGWVYFTGLLFDHPDGFDYDFQPRDAHGSLTNADGVLVDVGGERCDDYDCGTCFATLLVLGNDMTTASQYARLIDEIERGEREGEVNENTQRAVDFAINHGAPDGEWTSEWCVEIAADHNTIEQIERAADAVGSVRAYGRV